MGLVNEVFREEFDFASRLPGRFAVGHNRYSTSGQPTLENVQPLFADLGKGTSFTVAHNGEITNALTLKDTLQQGGAIFVPTSDTSVVPHLYAHSVQKESSQKRFIDAQRQMEGSWALISLATHRAKNTGMLTPVMMASRDPAGIRTLVRGEMSNGAQIFASETAALDIIGAEFKEEVPNGVTVVVDENGPQSIRYMPERPAQVDIFEYFYLAKPHSIIGGRSVYESRFDLGYQLGLEAMAAGMLDIDLVAPIPDSGNPAGEGFAAATQKMLRMGAITRNHYVGRTFISPDGKDGLHSQLHIKHEANRSLIKGKRIGLVDDTIMRGNTSRKIVRKVRAAGAESIWLYIASPPIAFADYYGVNTQQRKSLLASTHSIAEMAKYVEVDGLVFVSELGTYTALGHPGGPNPNLRQFADHPFSGIYPTELTDLNNGYLDQTATYNR